MSARNIGSRTTPAKPPSGIAAFCTPSSDFPGGSPANPRARQDCGIPPKEPHTPGTPGGPEPLSSPWKKSSLTFFHLKHLRFSRVLRTRDCLVQSDRQVIR